MANEQAGQQATRTLFDGLWNISGDRSAALTGSLAILAESLDKQLTEGASKAYVAVLLSLTRAEAVEAFSLALETCRYFPTPAELRSFGSPVEPDPVRTEARAAFKSICSVVRVHGVTLHGVAGEIISMFDEGGRRLREPLRHPAVYPRELPSRTKRAVEDMGTGNGQRARRPGSDSQTPWRTAGLCAGA